MLQIPIQEAPIWLVQTIINSSGKDNKKPASHYLGLLQGTGKGARNHSTASLAGLLLARGVDAQIAFEPIKAWNETRCKPLQSEDEVSKTFIYKANSWGLFPFVR